MKRFLAVLAVVATMALPSGHAAASLIEISLVPSQGRIDPPQNLFVDITISGLQSGGVDNLLGAWSMDLIYDSDVFVPLLIPPAGFGDRLGDVQSGQAVGGIDTTTPGTIGLFLVSLLFDFELDALQRDAAGNLLDGFTLATLGFFAPAGTGFTGLSTFIGTTNIVLADAFGNPLSDAAGAPIPIQHLPASIRVTEPATLALLLLALGLIGWSALKRQLGPIARRVC